MDFGGALKKLLGTVGNDVQHVRQAVGANPLYKAINSVNPLYPQPAISAESLRPNTKGADKFAPYAINGKPAPAPGWSIIPRVDSLQGGSVKMPTMQFPKYDFSAPELERTPVGIDGRIPQYYAPNGWSGTGTLIPNAQVPVRPVRASRRAV